MTMFSKRSLDLNASRGFTLIELLVVVAIIGILSSIVLASLNSARKKGRDARRVADIKQLQLALELYYDANTATGYPTTLDPLATGGFISIISKDPLGPTDYSYAALGSGGACTSYHIGASLEASTNAALSGDADAAADLGICDGSAADFAGADTGKCNALDQGATCYDVKP